MSGHGGTGQGWLLALDTATSTVVVAAGSLDGTVIAATVFEGGYRHSQELLPAVARLMADSGLALIDLEGIVVGTGPGAFTGLRVGLATAKTLAHELERPVVGIPSSEALIDAAGAVENAILWLPSGPRDRLAVPAGKAPIIVRAGDPLPAALGATDGSREDPGDADGAIAVDLDGRAPEAALARGRLAIDGLAISLLRLGARRLASGERDDPERLVPQYASAPRGAPSLEPEGSMAWSRDPR